MTEPHAVLARRELFPPAAVAAMLAFAGLPLYIHAPRYYAQEMGVGLATLGIVLLAARAVDSLQDPVIGRLADRWPRHREAWALVSGLLLFTGFALLFAPPQWGEALPRLAIGLLAAFTGFSALQIAVYDHGLAQAKAAGGGYTRIALWREAGGLVGICLAAMAPAVLGSVFGAKFAYVGYAAVFGLFSLYALGQMRSYWLASGKSLPNTGFMDALRVPGIAPLLTFGFVNALPTAVTSTLFLFFVTDILATDIHAGPMLLVFFAAAAMAAPAWAQLAERVGRKVALTVGMSLSIPAFVWAYLLGAGDIGAFYAIAFASGAALGADMTLVSAMLAARIRESGGRMFSLWTFMQKTTLALGAGITLPALALAGYEPGSETLTEEGRRALSVAYALVPCALKLIAIPVLWIGVSDQGDDV
ncbi:MAG: MFS transporter [Gammaproteobacteria bacterium]|nr:MFS transporter [Gammaproteobacteria bacterium]